MAASGPNAASPINAPIDDAAPSIPKDSANQLSTSSDLRSNDAEPAPDVSLAEHQAPTAFARPTPPDLLSHGRERTALTDEPADNTGTWVKQLYLIVTFLVVLVVMSYYAVFRYFVGGGAHMSDGHPVDDDHGLDDGYSNPEFYRKLREGTPLVKS